MTSLQQCRDISHDIDRGPQNIKCLISRHQMKHSEGKMQCRKIGSTMSRHQVRAIKVELNGPMSRHRVSNVTTSVEMIRTIDSMSRHQHDIKIQSQRANVATPNLTHDITVSMSRHRHNISTRAGFFLGFSNAIIVTSFLGHKS